MMTAAQPLHVSHLADDNNPDSTVCGNPWQSWQHQTAPSTVHISPPRPHTDRIRLCQACRRIALGLTQPAAETP